MESPNEINIIKMEDISKVYDNGAVALDSVDINIKRGEFVFIVGTSGAGKSTFVKLLLREILPTSGLLLVNGYNVNEMHPREIPYLRRSLGVIFQDYRLLPNKTVYENVAFAMRVIESPRRLILRSVNSVLDVVGLRSKYKCFPSQLSGGEQQRVGIVRAIIGKPEILLMDEPFSALDPISRRQLQDLIKTLHHELGLTIVFVTHNMEEAAYLGDRLCIMNHGEIIQTGTPDEIKSRPENDFVARFFSRGCDGFE